MARSSKRMAASKEALLQQRSSSLASNPIFLGLLVLTSFALAVSFVTFFLLAQAPHNVGAATAPADDPNANSNAKNVNVTTHTIRAEAGAPAAAARDAKAQQPDEPLTMPMQMQHGPHMEPRLPVLPVFYEIPNADALAQATLEGTPTMAGIVAILNRFLQELHAEHKLNALKKADVADLQDAYFQLAKKHLVPFDAAYRNKPIFPIREEGSIFISLAAFREHLLGQSLRSAFEQAKHPEKIVVGCVVQNCFGIPPVQCKTGIQVVGKDEHGQPKTKISDAPPDANGIEEFCTDPKYKKYCDSGQVRVLYHHDTDSLGPAIARYYASKLWGGETYFMQMDSHLEFAPEWDAKYIAEVQAAKAYPKAVLSAYPPGFSTFGAYSGGTPGARLCVCEFSDNGVEEHIIRINTGRSCSGKEPRPTQIPFIAAGFFFARAEFLVDVPFDPFLPWCFMGEEIALSMRAWTAGWDIYAPRQNLIAHQYRPGRLGLPKFWESVGRDSGRPGLNTKLQKHVIRRVKHLVGYPTDTKELIEADGDGRVLAEYDHYGLGTVRTREAYLELTNIDPVTGTCGRMDWCNHGTLE